MGSEGDVIITHHIPALSSRHLGDGLNAQVTELVKLAEPRLNLGLSDAKTLVVRTPYTVPSDGRRGKNSHFLFAGHSLIIPCNAARNHLQYFLTLSLNYQLSTMITN